MTPPTNSSTPLPTRIIVTFAVVAIASLTYMAYAYTRRSWTMVGAYFALETGMWVAGAAWLAMKSIEAPKKGE